MESVESLVRNVIQKKKNDMANEIIDAGKFDQSTSMEERRANLEALLQDTERMKVRAGGRAGCKYQPKLNQNQRKRGGGGGGEGG